jgi:hypothetical protein
MAKARNTGKSHGKLLACPDYIRNSIRMPNDDFSEVQQKLEAIVSSLKTVTDPERRRTLLCEMSRLIAEAERISRKPPKMSHNKP